jgi:hypothetical protein
LKLVQTLKRDYDLKRLEYRIKTYSRFRLMIVDEMNNSAYLLDLDWNTTILTYLLCYLPDPWIHIYSNNVYTNIKNSINKTGKY